MYCVKGALNVYVWCLSIGCLIFSRGYVVVQLLKGVHYDTLNREDSQGFGNLWITTNNYKKSYQ